VETNPVTARSVIARENRAFAKVPAAESNSTGKTNQVIAKFALAAMYSVRPEQKQLEERGWTFNKLICLKKNTSLRLPSLGVTWREPVQCKQGHTAGYSFINGYANDSAALALRSRTFCPHCQASGPCYDQGVGLDVPMKHDWRWYARATPAEEKTDQFHWERKDRYAVQAEIKAGLQQQTATTHVATRELTKLLENSAHSS
jgi:hypothetical protein